ncbi:MAG: hypothetical protein KBB11_01090 [Bacteroidales bacterium]|nr:hypothetical protein [Bacteroidales bacterium]HOY39128.1 hypothetical protein [Bacteroidales bacterium]HQP03239.1 hypothetical protein [Bacteroidales bacterium]
MKKINIFVIATLALIPLLKSCSDDPAMMSPESVNASIQESSWTISKFTEDNRDETTYFAGYSFEFGDNGLVTAVKQTNSFTGTYSSDSDDSTTKLYLDFGNQPPFDELNEDWEVLEKTDNKIRLQHVSGGDGSIDLLEFTKN